MSSTPDDSAPRRFRLAVARFWYEGNAFGPLPADQAAFERYEWCTGAPALAAATGTASELGGVAEFAGQHPEWEVVVLRCASASPAGPIDDSVFERFAGELRAGLEAGAAQGGWDAIYLSLHGAAITTRRQTPDLEIVRMVRGLLPQVPIGASFDLHGNMPPDMADLLDVAAVYRTHPHLDMAQAAQRVLTNLVRCATGGLRTRRVVLNEGLLLPSSNMRTAAGPMRLLEEAASAATTGAVLDVLVFGGFPYADTTATGASVFVYSDASLDPDGAQAEAAAQWLIKRIRELAPEFEVSLPSPESAVAAALRSSQPGLIAVTDGGDNPLSGGGGDTPGLFAALLAANPAVPCVFASFASPAAVDAARSAGIGQSIEVTLGGRFGNHFGPGVRVHAMVERIAHGVFRNEGPLHAGLERRCGGTAVLKVQGPPSLRVIVTEEVIAADDPAFYKLNGIDLGATRLLCAKAKNHFRAAFVERCSEIIDCSAPGPASVDLSGLPFRHARARPPG